ncbi:MAG: ferredoxin-like protein [Dehalococcoidia bacterium]|nr:ferredoxin-like protein [Dehalococcoidia bacterium]
MHHALAFYGSHQHTFLKAYISLAKLTSVPLIGALVRRIANTYAVKGHGGYLLSLAEAEQIIDSAEEIALGPCSCRQVFHNCDNPVMSELVLGDGTEVFKGKDFKKISKEEARDVLRQAHEKRLTHSIIKCADHFYAICNCCTCCCVPTRLRQKYGIDLALTRDPDIVQEFRRSQSGS